MKIRSAIPENGCLMFWGERKKNRKKTETSVKHILIRLIGGCVNNELFTLVNIVILIRNTSISLS